MDFQQWLAGIGDWASGLVAYVPQVLGALLWIGVGWIAARLAGSVSRRLIDSALGRLARRPSLQHALENTGARESIPRFTGGLLFWVVLLFFVAAAAETLGLPIVTASLNRFAYYLPNVLAAIVIVFAGMVIGHVARAIATAGAERAGVVRAQALGSIAQISVVLVSVIVALEQLGINGDVLVTMFAVIVGVLLATGGLAFGLGARETVSNLIARHYVALAYRPGETIRIDGLEGPIVDITPTAVVLDTGSGQASFPARRFQEVVSIRVPPGTPGTGGDR